MVSRTPVVSLPGVGPRTAQALARLGVEKAEDLLFLLPRAYQDRRHPLPFSSLAPGESATVFGQVLALEERGYRARKTLEMLISDGLGILVLKWFRFSPWLKKRLEKSFPPGATLMASGRVDTFGTRLEMHHPDLADPGDTPPGIVPVYPLTAGLSQGTLRRLVEAALERFLPGLEDDLPEVTRVRLGLPPLPESLRMIHQPSPEGDLELLNRGDSPAHRRLKFGELFLFQLGLLQRKRALSRGKGLALSPGRDLENRFLSSLPFALTGSQEKALGEIRRDLSGTVPMHRLLQGDVGSGKTVVAFLAMLAAVQAGHQAALMAPTEVLAEQHLGTLSPWCEGLGLPLAILTGKRGGRERQETLDRLAEGAIPLAVGTHALIQEGVVFRSLALAVVDEQHRFGVMQRLALQGKGAVPHFLVMTATPIPRSLSLSLFGDLDVSLMEGMPPGRRKVKTAVYPESQRSRMVLRIAEEVRAGRQAFLVYPLVEESEKVELAAAREMAERFRREIFPHLRVGLLTGRMAPEEKQAAMEAFRKGETQLLVATTVIEVGVDVPNATLMVVENAERFGLSQLHQLRGRVGRGPHPSRCILMAGPRLSREAQDRLEAMVRLSSGFEVAEEDLRIRGPGDFLGVRQAGWPDFRFAHPMRDRTLLMQAREEAERVMEGEQTLPPKVVSSLREFWGERLQVARSG